MSNLGTHFVQSLGEALAHVNGEGCAVVHEPLDPREIRERAGLTSAEMALLMRMSLSGYLKWEKGRRTVSGPAATLFILIAKEPEAVNRVLSI